VRLTKAAYIISCGLQKRLIFLYFFTLSKVIDDVETFLGYVLSTKFFFRILFNVAN